MHPLRSLFVLVLACSCAHGGDWPQWLGPNRDGSSPEKVAAWQGEIKVLWRQPVAEGHSSPVVAGGRVYLHTRLRDRDAEELAAYEALTGKPLWRTSYTRAPFSSPFGMGPRATPSVVANRVYTFGVTGVLGCFDAAQGKQLWQVDTLKEFKAANLTFGVSCSPLVDGNRVLVNVGGKGASIVAFDTEKGTVHWKQLDAAASYSSPIVFGQGPSRQVVFLTQQGLAALQPETGTVFWQFPFVDLLSESSTTPVRRDDLLLASSVTVGSVGLRLGQKDDRPAATQVWKNPALSCYFSTPVVVGAEHVYMVTGTIVPPPSATLRCVELKTGKELWQKPKVGRYHAALLRTGDSKLLMLEDTGSLVLLEPNATAYRELARAKVCGHTWAHPALADGRLYLRDDRELLCLQLGEPAEGSK